jgi:hypothetical protein
MGKLLSINHKFGKADIALDDGLIRLFVKFQDGICSEIRVWKLPLKGSFWSMFRPKNLIWAIYRNNAKYIHGWFAKEGNFLEVLTAKIERCNNYDELKNVLIEIENITKGIMPSCEL